MSEMSAWIAKEVAGDPRKFSHYVLVPNHPTGKGRLFISSLGYRAYSAEDAAALLVIYIAQARERFDRGEVAVGEKDDYGQRFTIVIEVPGRGVAAGQMYRLKTGWILKPDGTLRLATPMTGFAD